MPEPVAPNQLPEPSQSAPLEPQPEQPQQPDAPAEEPQVAPELQQKLYDAFGEGEGPPDAPQERPRDAQGRFLPQEGSDTPETPGEPSEAPAAPSFAPEWIQAAKEMFFNDAEIAGFSSEAALQDAIVGRQVRMARQMGWQPPAQGQPSDQPTASPVQQQQQFQQQPPPPATQQALEDLALTIDEAEMGAEIATPIKSLEQHVNQLKATLVDENKQLRQQMMELRGQVEQSAQTSQTAQAEQYARNWDAIAGSVPGMVEAMGKPSEARAKPGSAEYTRWMMIEPAVRSITERYMQVLGPDRIDQSVMSRIAREPKHHPRSRRGRCGGVEAHHAAGERTIRRCGFRSLDGRHEKRVGAYRKEPVSGVVLLNRSTGNARS
ncbi:MAG: hypothetical protein ACYSUQ_08205 [Planctomycetota bacterium]|jgi:hypothetical protein